MARHSYPRHSIQNESEPLLSSSEEDGDPSNLPPRDRYSLSYLSMIMFGLAALLPWNMFITATSYFQEKFKNGSPFVLSQFENFFTIFSQITSVAFLFINVHLQSRFSAFSRIMVTLVLMVILFTATTVLAFVDTTSWTDGFFVLTVIMIVIFNACTGVFQGGCFGLAASFTARHTQGFMSGQGVGGIFASLASIISIAVTHGEDPILSGFYYFLAATLVIILAIALFPIFLRLPISRFYLDQVVDELSQSFRAPSVSAWTIIKQIRWMLFSVWFCFTVSLAVFPSLTASIQSVTADSPLTTTYWTPVTCFLLFNFGDFVGRTVAGSLQLLNQRWLVILTLARVIFIPLFALCNNPSSTREIWFDSDVYPIVFMTLFAVTNGYFASLAMMYAPDMVPAGPESSTAGAYMAFGLGAGLMTGAFLSFAVNALL